MMFKIFTSFTFMIFMGIIVGLITGGFPYYSNEISTLALLIAMTFSLTNVDIKKVKFNKNQFLLPLLLNYGILSGLTILLGLFFPKNILNGFIIIAAVPPAVAIIPLTKVLKGDIKYSLISITFLYLISIILTPLIIYLTIGRDVNILSIIQTIILLIIFPIIISQFIRRYKISANKKNLVTNICFFILIFILIGDNRSYLFQKTEIIFWIAMASFIRTFGIGGLIKLITEKIGINYKKRIPLILFSSIKNEGYAIIIGLTLFGGIVAVPAIIALVFEMIWIACFEAKIC